MIDGVEMITNSDIENAQREWGEGIVRIASSYRDGGDYVGVAEKHIHSLYAYGSGPVSVSYTHLTLPKIYTV